MYYDARTSKAIAILYHAMIQGEENCSSPVSSYDTRLSKTVAVLYHRVSNAFGTHKNIRYRSFHEEFYNGV